MQESNKKFDRTELMRTVKFILFSISAGVIQIGSFTLMNELFHWKFAVSYVISIVLSVIWNFTFNRRFTFKSAANVPKAMIWALLFYVPFIPLSTLLGNWLTETCGWNEYIVEILNMLLNFVLEYIYQRFFVFRDSIDTNDLAKKEKDLKDNE